MRGGLLLLVVGCALGCVSGCVQNAAPVIPPVGPAGPVGDAPVFPQVAAMVDGGRFSLTVNPTTFEAGNGASLAIPATVSGTMERSSGGIVLVFDKPLPTGAAKRYGLKFSAGITRLEIEAGKITAVTDTMGKRFVWELRETP